MLGPQPRVVLTLNAKAYLIFAAAAIASISQSPAQQRGRAVPPELEARLKEFFVQKEDQARALAKEENSEQAPEVWTKKSFKRASDRKSTRLNSSHRYTSY